MFWLVYCLGRWAGHVDGQVQFSLAHVYGIFYIMEAGHELGPPEVACPQRKYINAGMVAVGASKGHGPSAILIIIHFYNIVSGPTGVVGLMAHHPN